MERTAFWALVEASKRDAGDDQDAQERALAAALSPLEPDALVAFREQYDALLEGAHHWDLWAAAFLINGGASDDGFDYFLDWLIAQGQDAYEAALEDPESLTEIATPDEAEFEAFRYVVGDVYREKTGEDMPLPSDARGEPAGEPFDEETVEARFPRLAAWVAAQ